MTLSKGLYELLSLPYIHCCYYHHLCLLDFQISKVFPQYFKYDFCFILKYNMAAFWLAGISEIFLETTCVMKLLLSRNVKWRFSLVQMNDQDILSLWLSIVCNIENVKKKEKKKIFLRNSNENTTVNDIYLNCNM